MKVYEYKTRDKVITNCVFSDIERNSIKGIRTLLITMQKSLSATNSLHNWNANDQEALHEIMEWPLHFSDKGTMRDLNLDQIKKIEKMFRKFKITDSFAYLCDVYVEDDYIEGDTMDEYEMRLEMDRRRSIQTKSSSAIRTHHDDLFDFSAI